MEEWSKGIIFGLIFGILLGILLCLIFYGINPPEEPLGQAICENEYDMDFWYFESNVLHCKPKEERYDGIKVELGGEK